MRGKKIGQIKAKCMGFEVTIVVPCNGSIERVPTGIDRKDVLGTQASRALWQNIVYKALPHVSASSYKK